MSASASLNTRAAAVTPEAGVIRELHASLLNSAECATSRDQEFEGSSAARTRLRTLDQCAVQQQIPGTACTASRGALNSVRPLPRVTLFTTSAPPTRDDLLSTSAQSHTPSVLPVWQHPHSHSIALCCAAAAHSPSNVRTCCRMAESLVAERAAGVASRSRERVACLSRESVACHSRERAAYRSRERVACSRRHAARRRARNTFTL